MDSLLQLIFGGLEYGSIYALATLGIMLIYKTSSVTNFAQGMIGMFCGFFVAAIAMGAHQITTYAILYGIGIALLLGFYLWKKKGLHPLVFILPLALGGLYGGVVMLLGPTIWGATLVGLATAFLTGILIDFVIIRRAQKVNPLAKQIITMGLVIVFLGITPMIFKSLLEGVDPVRVPRFITEGVIRISGAAISFNAIFNILVGIIIMVGLFLFLQKTRWGLAVRVTASNPEVARMMGVPTKMVTVGSWAVAAMFAALAAIMYAPTIGIITPTYMTVIQVVAFVACVFGGFQTFHGPVIAAYVLAIIRSIFIFYGASFLQLIFGSQIPDDFGSVWGEQILYILIILFIVFRPYGLIGKKVIKKV